MRLTAIELRRVALPLTRPFRTSFGTQTARDVLLVRVMTEAAEGWGECAALTRPVYSPEYVDSAHAVIRDVFAPDLLARDHLEAHHVGLHLERYLGHPMAKSAVETAVLDAQLRAQGISLASHLGAVRDRVDCGVSVGIADTVEALVEEVGGYLEQGYRRIKLKIEPGWDVEPLTAVREAFGAEVLLQVDANTAYGPADTRHLRALDAFDLALIEQPFAHDDLHLHAELAAVLQTPVCLDESITSSATAALALQLGSCSIINIKAGRVGGYLEAVRVHDVARAMARPVWCGGMLETGIGRAANVALAALPGFTLPGDTSASDRYFSQDLTQPFVLDDGQLEVPRGPGIGVEIDLEYIERITTHRALLRRSPGT